MSDVFFGVPLLPQVWFTYAFSFKPFKLCVYVPPAPHVSFSNCWLNAVLQDWGKPGDLWNLGIQWHVPSSEEVAFAFYLLDSFLQPELSKLQRCGDGELEMSRLVFFYNQLVMYSCGLKRSFHTSPSLWHIRYIHFQGPTRCVLDASHKCDQKTIENGLQFSNRKFLVIKHLKQENSEFFLVCFQCLLLSIFTCAYFGKCV